MKVYNISGNTIRQYTHITIQCHYIVRSAVAACVLFCKFEKDPINISDTLSVYPYTCSKFGPSHQTPSFFQLKFLNLQ